MTSRQRPRPIAPVRWREGGATFSPCLTYRYTLDRIWDQALPQLCWVMLNPSTADGREDDPTIRKCVGFAARWGYGSIVVVNLFAYRATKPRDLWKAQREGVDIIGPGNPDAFHATFECSKDVAVAWGGGKLSVILEGFPERLLCIGQNRDGSPTHPCMAPYGPHTDFVRKVS